MRMRGFDFFSDTDMGRIQLNRLWIGSHFANFLQHCHPNLQDSCTFFPTSAVSHAVGMWLWRGVGLSARPSSAWIPHGKDQRPSRLLTSTCQMADAELGPCLQTLKQRAVELRQRAEPQVQQRVLA